MALLTIPASEKAAPRISGGPSGDRVTQTQVARRLRFFFAKSTETIRLSVIGADTRVCAGGGLAVMGGDLPAHTESCWNGCYTTVQMLEPGSEIPPYIRDRTVDILSIARKRPQPSPVTAASRVDNMFSQVCIETLRVLNRADYFVVIAGGMANIQALYSAGDYVELESCWDEWVSIILQIDPAATPPAFNRNRADDIAAYDAVHGPAPVT